NKMFMAYTSGNSRESTLRLAEIVDGAPRNDRVIARSSDAEFIGPVFAEDGHAIYFLLQDQVDGTGKLYKLRLSPIVDIAPFDTNANQGVSPGSNTGILFNFSHDNGPCQDSSSDVASVAWYHRTPTGGRFEPVCQSPSAEKLAAETSVDSEA